MRDPGACFEGIEERFLPLQGSVGCVLLVFSRAAAEGFICCQRAWLVPHGLCHMLLIPHGGTLHVWIIWHCIGSIWSSLFWGAAAGEFGLTTKDGKL